MGAFDLGLGNLSEFGVGEFQPQSYDFGFDYQDTFNPALAFGSPQPQQTRSPFSLEAQEQKRDGILQSLADQLAGEEYYGVDAADRDRAMGQAMMSIGTSLINAAGAGSWSGAQKELGAALPQAQSAFKTDLTQAATRQAYLEDRQYQATKRKQELETGDLELEDKRSSLEQKKAARLGAKQQIEDWSSTFKSMLDSPDIDPRERKLYEAKFTSILRNYAIAPENPNVTVSLLNFLGEVGTESGKTDELSERVNVELQTAAAKGGFPSVEDYLKNLQDKSKLELDLKGLQIGTEKAQQGYYGSQTRRTDAETLAIQRGEKYGGSDTDEATKRAREVLNVLLRDENLRTMISEAKRDPGAREAFAMEYGPILRGLGIGISNMVTPQQLTEIEAMVYGISGPTTAGRAMPQVSIDRSDVGDGQAWASAEAQKLVEKAKRERGISLSLDQALSEVLKSNAYRNRFGSR